MNTFIEIIIGCTFIGLIIFTGIMAIKYNPVSLQLKELDDKIQTLDKEIVYHKTLRQLSNK